MAANSTIRKNHLEQSLRASHSEVLTLIKAAADDIDALQQNYESLQAFIVSAKLGVDNNGKIYQIHHHEEA